MITDLPPGTPPVAEPADSPPGMGTRRRLPRNYDRTWELELLISGAVTFTLLQLPGAVDGAFDRISPRLGDGLFRAMMFAYIYLKVILYALISTFVVHLAARAYWVGLVGLASVYPKGVRWEETKYGPITKEFYRERLPTLQQQTAAVDRFCSVLFSFATIIVLTFVSSTVSRSESSTWRSRRCSGSSLCATSWSGSVGNRSTAMRTFRRARTATR